MKRTIYFVIKFQKTSKLLQNFDVFESFKFVGDVLPAEQADTHFHMTPKQVLDEAVRANEKTDEYAVVGAIIPDVGAAFLPGHKVFSTGTAWCTVEEMCGSYNAKLME